MTLLASFVCAPAALPVGCAGQPRRVVLLGASNVALGFRRLLPLIRQRAGGPVELLAAFGHGRSYGTWTTLAGIRGLPGIVDCGLWARLAAGGPPPLALLTDIGNDLAYGQPAERIAAWVGECLDRLGRAGAVTILSLPPLASLEGMPPWRFHLARTLLFPGRPLQLGRLLAAAAELDARLRELGRAAGATVVAPDPAWYGFDPIHIQRKAAAAAWERILAGWPAGGAPEGKHQRLPSLRAAERRLLGFTVQTPQPSARLADGTTLHLY